MKKTLYHGSDHIIEKPIYGFGKPYNDYGLGFYCTESLDLAKEWSVGENTDGYANIYELETEGLNFLDLSDPQYNTLHWIALLLRNRIFDIKNDIARAGKEYILQNYSLPVEEYDVIEGYRADDSYFSYAKSFLNNTISVRRLSEALRLGHLGKQVVLISEKAFGALKFGGYETAPTEKYFPLRKERNEKARSQFLSDRSGSVTPDDIYLADLLRGGVSKDDPRLQ